MYLFISLHLTLFI